MELTERIVALLGGLRLPMSEVAARIVEIANTHGAELDAAAVESLLPGFKTDDIAALRYFFEDPVRSGAFLEAIGVAAEEREAYRLAAAALIAGVVVRDHPSRRSPFAAVVGLVRELSWEQLLDDPFLDRSFAALHAEGFATLDLEYARASLLHHNKLPVFAGPRRADWRDALQAILAHDPPAAGLRLRTTTGSSGHQPLLPGRRKLGRLIELDDSDLLALRAIVPFRVRRDQPRPGAFGGLRGSSAGRLHLQLPTADELSHPARLLERLVQLHGHRDGTPSRSDPDFTAIPIDHRVWEEADDQIGAVWLALRRAVGAAEGVTLHMGDGLLEMGAGVVARVVATRRSPLFVSDSSEADLFFETIEHYPEKLKEPSDHLLQAIETGSATTGGVQTVSQALVPRTLYLARGAHRVVITFRGTCWSVAGRSFDPRVAHAAAAEERPSRP